MLKRLAKLTIDQGQIRRPAERFRHTQSRNWFTQIPSAR